MLILPGMHMVVFLSNCQIRHFCAERVVAHSMQDDQALLGQDLPRRIMHVLSMRKQGECSD